MSENQEIIPYDETGGSFWEINGYKPTSRRVNDGHALCNDLMSMIKERSEIENKYSTMLRQWSKKWYDHIGKGPEYGTTEGAWQGLFVEADRLGNMHAGVRDELANDIYTKVKQWQKETYTKQKLGGLKQHKEMDDGFAKAQKPWAKKFDKVMKAKDDFHKACKSLRTAEINERNQQADTSISEDQHLKAPTAVVVSLSPRQKRKNVLKIEEWENKRDITRAKYENALQDITDYNARYMEDMTEVFSKCQGMEERRQEFFKEVLYDVQQCLNLSENPDYPLIYSDLHYTISNADSQKDLKWWSQAHGIDMAMFWPTFEEFTPQQANLSKKSMRSRPMPDEGITLTLLRKEEPAAAPQSYNRQSTTGRGVDSNRNTYNGSEASQEHSPLGQRVSNQRAASHYEPALNPFGNAEEDTEDLSDFDSDMPGGDDGDNAYEEDDDYLVDDGRPGVPIRALYDYDGGEDDELTFKAGDEFEKLEDEDEQGWCKGRLDGKLGLYPANYCAEI